MYLQNKGTFLWNLLLALDLEKCYHGVHGTLIVASVANFIWPMTLAGLLH